MIKKSICLLLFFLCAIPALLFAETLTLTTYYPAPFGAYDQLRLVPRAAQSGACNPGTFYVRNDTYVMEFCTSAGTWGTMPGVWIQSGTSVYPASYATASVAIGTNDPGIARTYISNAGTSVGLYIGNGTPFGQAYIEQDGPAATHIWVAESGTNVFNVASGGNAYFAGNVGIRNSSATQALQIGSLTSSASATPIAIDLGGTYSNTAGTNLKFRLYDDGSNIGGFGISANQMDYKIWSNAADHVFYQGTTEIMRIKGNGNVGIGVNPSTKLEVNGTVKITGGTPGAGKFLMSDADGDAVWAYPTYAP